MLQARAAELRRQKVEHEKAWAAAQRERELQKVRGPADRALLCWHPGGTPWPRFLSMRPACLVRVLPGLADWPLCWLCPAPCLCLQLAEEQELEKQAAVQASERYR
jgi:hypothetical protein